MRILPSLSLCVLATACGPKLIPNTQIADTPETHAVLELVGRYRTAVEARNPEGLLAVVSHNYFDKNLDYTALAGELPKKFALVKIDKLDLEVKNVTVKNDEALVDVYYIEHYLLALPSGETWQQRSDDSRFTLRREEGAWKIVAGL